MITHLRWQFNQEYTDSGYDKLLEILEQRSGTSTSFRVAETPVFFPKSLIDDLASLGSRLTRQLMGDEKYLNSSLAIVPEKYRAVADTPHPHFMTVDFGLVRTSSGEVKPKLVEMQAFPSVFAFQVMLAKAYQEAYRLPPDLDFFLGGHTEETFWRLFRQVVIAEHDPDEVVLAEIHPEQQKTLPDFLLTSKKLGIPTLDVTQLTAAKHNSRIQLFYKGGKGNAEGALQRVRRIYNRVIVDELIQKGIRLPFDYRDDLDVEWAGHPNWYFRISKYSIPFLRDASVPEAVFLDDWMAGAGSNRLHPPTSSGREDILLKPLFSFAGKGIVFAPTDEQIAAIPEGERREYLIQERVNFAPIIETPFGATQAEIRILYLWPDGGKMEPVLSLARLGRGKMMGVDHNRDQKWIGASTVYYPRNAQ